MLQFCCLGAFPRERLLIREIEQKLGTLSGKHLQLGKHYLDTEGAKPRLAMMRIDHGSDPAHILRRARAQIEASVKHPIIAQLVKQQSYMMAIITSEQEKVIQIQDAILRQTWPLPFRVEAVPGLTAILAANLQQRLRLSGEA